MRRREPVDIWTTLCCATLHFGVAHICTGTSAKRKYRLNIEGNNYLGEAASSIGGGDGNRWDSLLSRPDSCPMNGDHPSRAHLPQGRFVPPSAMRRRSGRRNGAWTEPRNTSTMGAAATADSTAERRRLAIRSIQQKEIDRNSRLKGLSTCPLRSEGR
jgi:hypothetical protein